MNPPLKTNKKATKRREMADTGKKVHGSVGNIFADLGLPEPEKFLAKAELARWISAIIRDARWDQKEASRRLGIDQPKISNLVRGKLNDFSIERLMDFLASLDRDIFITVRPTARHGHAGVHVLSENHCQLVLT